MAARHRISPGQAALAWLLYRSSNVVPIPGTTSLDHLEENVRAMAVRYTPEDMAELEAG